MVYHERAAWSGLIAAVLTIAVYGVLLTGRIGDGPVTAVDWWPLMAGVVIGGVLLSILLSIGWGIVAGMRDRHSAAASDIRDLDISRFGGRAEHVVLIITGLAVLVLCAVDAAVFWIAHTMFLGFAVAAVLGGVARVIAYRRGLA